MILVLEFWTSSVQLLLVRYALNKLFICKICVLFITHLAACDEGILREDWLTGKDPGQHIQLLRVVWLFKIVKLFYMKMRVSAFDVNCI